MPSVPPARRRHGGGVSLEDVAALAGVSLATASRVLNGASIVRTDSRERVESAAADLGYRTNQAAQAIARGYSRALAVLVTDLTDPAASAIAEGVVAGAAHHGVVATVTTLGSEPIAMVIRRIRTQRPQAFIVESSALQRGAADAAEAMRELTAYEAEGGTVVVVGASDGRFLERRAEEASGCEQLAHTLAELGYRAPLILSGGGPESARADSLQSGFAAAGIHPRMVELPRGDPARDRAYRFVVAAVSEREPMPDVICCTSDLAAIGTLAALRDLGLRPGEGIAVSGIGGIPYSTDTDPQLTTLDLDLEAQGADAVAIAFGQSASPPTSSATVRLRESTPRRTP